MKKSNSTSAIKSSKSINSVDTNSSPAQTFDIQKVRSVSEKRQRSAKLAREDAQLEVNKFQERKEKYLQIYNSGIIERNTKDGTKKIRLSISQRREVKVKIAELDLSLFEAQQKLKKFDYGFKSVTELRLRGVRMRKMEFKDRLSLKKYDTVTKLMSNISSTEDFKILNELKSMAKQKVEFQPRVFESRLSKFVNKLNKGNYPLGSLPRAVIENVRETLQNTK